MTKKILVVLGHPDEGSFCVALAQAYVDGAKQSGAEVRELVIRELQFDPILHHGYREIQQLEPDLVKAQDAVRWADHLVFVYPTWWGAMPALLKGFFERMWLPGFGYKFREKGMMWDKLLKGKSARLIVTMGNYPILYRLIFGACGHRLMRQGILGFCGVKPVKITSIGSMMNASDIRRKQWVEEVQALGKEQK